MKINWKVRLKNGVFLASIISLVITFVYNILALLDIYPAITQSMVIQLCNQVLLCLAAVGIISDPTTVGLGDSKRALGYDEPWSDNG